jgi:hypothetical protein
MAQKRKVFFGESALHREEKQMGGQIVELDGEKFYRISNFDEMPPFFMTLVSDSDHWMFLSSRGGLTCGRRAPENALFPYYTDDKIHDGSSTTGPLSILLIEKEGRSYLWEPFGVGCPDVYRTEKNLCKNIAGNTLIFEAINQTLQLKYSYSWQNSDRFGFIKQTVVTNTGKGNVGIRILDGIRNILPFGVNMSMQLQRSTLLDGYKRCELHESTGLGIYTLSSIPTDKAEPSEALKATTVWAAGYRNPVYLLSEKQITSFMNGTIPETEMEIKGMRGAYLVYEETMLAPDESQRRMIAAEVNQGPSKVTSLIRTLQQKDLVPEVREDVRMGTHRLMQLVGLSDGLQLTANELKSARHYSNTLFNVMRGGIFPHGYQVPVSDFESFLIQRNLQVSHRTKDYLESIDSEYIPYPELLAHADQKNDNDLLRLAYEYLPLTFSRRHGDPSRPWNAFSIDVRTEKGELSFNYQGNWRDIFQNWEALALSFPGFIESFIAKFLNASTLDGYNPYRITREGIDWEVMDPNDPWSYIGYWGDHQVIYLVKLLELSLKYHPEKMQRLLARELFTYADVPYRIKSYEEIIADPTDTIEFDDTMAKAIDQRVKEMGSDGKLVQHGSGIYHVTLMEKLLVPLLSKLTNFIPGGGIWMNTQRPEWNDANNALVGNGLSMVTLYYIRRYITVFQSILAGSDDAISLTLELGKHFQELSGILKRFKKQLAGGFNDVERKNFTDAVGKAGSDYRASVYPRVFDHPPAIIRKKELQEFLGICMEYIDESIAANRREDLLFHAYNLAKFSDRTCTVSHLYEMLEGQVAVISSGYLSPAEVLDLLDALRKSRMYRIDQRSYTLYPDRKLAPFLTKNLLDPAVLEKSGFLTDEVSKGNSRIIEKDEAGGLHFNGSFRNVDDLKHRLDAIDGLTDQEKELICDAFIETFNHRQFTGRSGTFYKYEGLGSIYWHMVSKLLLAVQEVYLHARHSGEQDSTLQGLKDHLEQIEEGIGAGKSPAEYGAFPIDPYSHTPGFAGVQQPGMTGQVKEDILTRFGELGLSVKEGTIQFDPALLSGDEFLQERKEWALPGQQLTLEPGQLGFSLCSIPVIYSLGETSEVMVEFQDGKRLQFEGNMLPADISSLVFSRSSTLARIEVYFRSIPHS